MSQQQEAQERLDQIEATGGNAGEEVIQEAMALAEAAQKAENMFSTVSDVPNNQSVADSAARLERQEQLIKSPAAQDWEKNPIYDRDADISQSSTAETLPFDQRPTFDSVRNDILSSDLAGLSDATTQPLLQAGDNELIPFELRQEAPGSSTALTVSPSSAPSNLLGSERVPEQFRLLPSGELNDSYADDLLSPHGAPKSDIQEAKEQLLSGIFHEKQTNKRDFNSALNKVEHGVDVVAGDLEKGAADTKENLIEGKENLKYKYYSVKQTVGQALEEAKQQLSEGVDDVKRDAIDAYESVARSLSNAKETVVEYYDEAAQQVSSGVDGVIRQAKEGIDEVKHTFSSEEVDEIRRREEMLQPVPTTATAEPLLLPAPETRVIETRVVEVTPSSTRPRGWSMDRVGASLSETVDEIGESIGETVGSIGETVGEIGESIGERVGETVDSIGETLHHIKDEIVGAFTSDSEEEMALERPLLLERKPLDNATIAEEKKLVELVPHPLVDEQRQQTRRTFQDQ